MKSICKTGTAAYNGIHPEMLEAVAAGKFKGIEKLITRKIAIEDLVEKGIMALLHEKDKHGQNLILTAFSSPSNASEFGSQNSCPSLMHLNIWNPKCSSKFGSLKIFFLVCNQKTCRQLQIQLELSLIYLNMGTKQHL
jgi:hypothetical protein